MKKLLLLVIASALLFSCNDQHKLIKNKELKKDISNMLLVQKELAKGREQELFSFFDEDLTLAERQAMEYLYAYMPLSDLADYDGNFFLSNVRTSLKALDEMPWGKNIPEDVYLHYVLPIRTNNENLDDFRTLMYPELKERIEGMTMHDAALEINHWCHEKVNYQPGDARTSSPLATMKTSFGRCGEESVFTVAAMRAVCIPARQVYTPKWGHTDSNHAWVEVWIDGTWYYLGACEPEPELDMGWFTEPARRAMLVHTRAYGKYSGKEMVITDEKRFSELNVTDKYAQTADIVIKVVEDDLKSVASADVEFGLYNYAQFHTIAKKITDDGGYVNFNSGMGDMLISASHKEKGFGSTVVRMGEADTVVVTINNTFPKADFVFDAYPPIERTPYPPKVSDEFVKQNEKRLAYEDSIRNSYIDTFADSAFVAKFAAENGYPEQLLSPIFKESYGNWESIAEFLKQVTFENKTWAVRLLQNVSNKDLRDTPQQVLENHLNYGLKYTDKYPKNEPEMYAKYVLSPRIEYELLTPWRNYLQEAFPKDFVEKYNLDEEVLIKWINDNIVLNTEANMHSRAPLSPIGVHKLKVADTRSVNIFYVAVARSLGHMARVNKETGTPQYYDGKKWINVSFYKDDSSKEDNAERGYIVFKNEDKSTDPKYSTNFTIARLIDNRFRTVSFDSGKPLSEFDYPVEVESGKYRLTTGNRQTDGSVLCNVTYFEVLPKEISVVNVVIRQNTEKPEAIGAISNLNHDLTELYSEEKVNVNELIGENISLFLWLDPSREPSRHVLKDIGDLNNIIDSEKANVIFALGSVQEGKQINKDNYPNLPKNAKYVVDNDFVFLKEVENVMKREVKHNMPIIIILQPNGEIYYYSEGYRVGVGEELGKELLRMK
ncbi:MAG: transglutaminase-like domain-containing protein [Bacteroidales bacterium]|jgi:hypothetical protein